MPTTITTEAEYTVYIDHIECYKHEIKVTASSNEEASELALSRFMQFGQDLFTEIDYLEEDRVESVILGNSAEIESTES